MCKAFQTKGTGRRFFLLQMQGTPLTLAPSGHGADLSELPRNVSNSSQTSFRSLSTHFRRGRPLRAIRRLWLRAPGQSLLLPPPPHGTGASQQNKPTLIHPVNSWAAAHVHVEKVTLPVFPAQLRLHMEAWMMLCASLSCLDFLNLSGP